MLENIAMQTTAELRLKVLGKGVNPPEPLVEEVRTELLFRMLAVLEDIRARVQPTVVATTMSALYQQPQNYTVPTYTTTWSAPVGATNWGDK